MFTRGKLDSYFGERIKHLSGVNNSARKRENVFTLSILFCVKWSIL